MILDDYTLLMTNEQSVGRAWPNSPKLHSKFRI